MPDANQYLARKENREETLRRDLVLRLRKVATLANLDADAIERRDTSGLGCELGRHAQHCELLAAKLQAEVADIYCYTHGEEPVG